MVVQPIGGYMNWDQVEGKWKEFAGSARAHWGKRTGVAWATVASKKEQLAGRIQRRYGIAKEEAEEQIAKWAQALNDAVHSSKAKSHVGAPGAGDRTSSPDHGRSIATGG